MWFVEQDGLRIYLDEEVYKPREDSFMVVDALKPIVGSDFAEVGSGSGIITISLMKSEFRQVIATDINYQAAKMTKRNCKVNGKDLVHVVCTSLLLPFRKDSLPNTVIFNPPYLPEDDEVDVVTPKFELQQLVGGKQGYEMALACLELLDHTSQCVFLIISSLATNPVDFDRMTPKWKSSIVHSEYMGFETIWLVKLGEC